MLPQGVSHFRKATSRADVGGVSWPEHSKCVAEWKRMNMIVETGVFVLLAPMVARSQSAVHRHRH